MMINRDETTNTPGEMHPWDVSPQQAVDIQVGLSSCVIREDSFGKISTVAGVDVGFNNETEFACAAISVLSFPELQFMTSATILNQVDFPYIPGLLSFREIPAILKALGQLDLKPDLFICDGHGTAHPRRFGLACHLGVLIDTPCIGVAKSRLIGTYQAPGTRKGDWTPILDGESTIGAVLRTQTNVKPIYASIGHRISLETAISTILQCTTRYRLPEPIRMAHRLASVQ